MNLRRVSCYLTGMFLAATALAQQPAPAEKPVATFGGHTAAIAALAFSPDGRQIVSACAKDVRAWDPATGKEIVALKGVGRPVVAFSPDGKTFAAAGREAVTVHDAASGKELLSIDPHGDYNKKFPFRPAVVALAFSPDGARLATAGSVAKVGGPHGYPGGVVTIWDVKTGQALHRFDTLSTSASTVVFGADGKTVVAGTNGAGGELPEPAEVVVWDADKGKALQTFKTNPAAEPGEFQSAADVAISPDGKRVAAAVSSGSRGRPAGLLTEDRPSLIRVWDLASGKEALTLKGHKSWVGRVVFSPDGKRLATAGGDRVVKLWDAATGKEIAAFPFDGARIDALAFSPDGKRVAAGGGENQKPGEIKVWACPGD